MSGFGEAEVPALLEQALVRLVDATLCDDLPGAVVAFADAQAHGLEQAGLEAELWAAVELRAAAALPDEVDDPVVGERLLRQARAGGVG